MQSTGADARRASCERTRPVRVHSTRSLPTFRHHPSQYRSRRVDTVQSSKAVATAAPAGRVAQHGHATPPREALPQAATTGAGATATPPPPLPPRCAPGQAASPPLSRHASGPAAAPPAWRTGRSAQRAVRTSAGQQALVDPPWHHDGTADPGAHASRQVCADDSGCRWGTHAAARRSGRRAGRQRCARGVGTRRREWPRYVGHSRSRCTPQRPSRQRWKRERWGADPS